jgi:hypothetical protein
MCYTYTWEAVAGLRIQVSEVYVWHTYGIARRMTWI